MELQAKILVVGDEAVVCRTCLEVLARDGHDVSIALPGEEALREIESECFDVVVLELMVPGSGRLRLLRAIRKASPQTEIVVITGQPTIESAKESIRLGAFDYVSKPLLPQTLRTMVAQVLACKPWKMQER